MVQEDTAGYEAAGELQELCCSCGTFYCYACYIKIDDGGGVVACHACGEPIDSATDASEQNEQMQQLLLTTPQGRYTPIVQYKLGVSWKSITEPITGFAVAHGDVAYLRQSAESGYPPAQLALASRLEVGDVGVDINIAEATKWLRLAAAVDHKQVRKTASPAFR